MNARRIWSCKIWPDALVVFRRVLLIVLGRPCRLCGGRVGTLLYDSVYLTGGGCVTVRMLVTGPVRCTPALGKCHGNKDTCEAVIDAINIYLF